MESVTKSDFKESLQRLSSRYQNIVAAILFLGGIGLRIASLNRTGAIWPIVGELGTFVAAVIAIPFIYEKLVKSEDRQVFLSDLEDVLESKLSLLAGGPDKHIRVHENGRLALSAKVTFFEDAESEIIELATAARSFANYFEARPFHEFKQPVINVLKRGVDFKVLLLDPDSPSASAYADDMKEPGLISKIRRSTEKLLALRDEFEANGYPGKFEVRLYSQLPSCYLLMVDPERPSARMHYSHYLNGLKRADTPVVEISKQDNPMLFEKYLAYVRQLEATCRPAG